MSNVEFLGIVRAPSLIDAAELADRVGLKPGTEQNNLNAWLHYNIDGKELYVSMKPMRYGVSWNDLNEMGLVFGETELKVKGETYKVRLLKGINGKPKTLGGAYDPEWAHGSEWNRMMYPVHCGDHIDPNNAVASNIGDYVSNEFEGLTDADLAVNHQVAIGSRSWCQERHKNMGIQRGMFGVAYYTKYAVQTATTTFGWRPVLEKVASE